MGGGVGRGEGTGVGGGVGGSGGVGGGVGSGPQRGENKNSRDYACTGVLAYFLFKRFRGGCIVCGEGNRVFTGARCQAIRT